MSVHSPPKTVLVASDLSEAAEAPLRFAALLRDTLELRCVVMNAHLVQLPSWVPLSRSKQLLGSLDEQHDAVVEQLRRQVTPILGSGAETLVFHGAPRDAIIEAARQVDADLLVLGTHGHGGLRRLWLGSVAEDLLRTSELPVLSVRPGRPIPRLEHLLCPVSGSAVGQAALTYAVRLAEALAARLTLVHAAEQGAPPERCPGVESILIQRSRIDETVVEGDAATAILEAVKRSGAQLVVMGAARRSSLFGTLFSGTTEKVMKLLEAPLLLVPQAEEVTE